MTCPSGKVEMSPDDARRAASRHRRDGSARKAYRCSECPHWHLANPSLRAPTKHKPHRAAKDDSRDL